MADAIQATQEALDPEIKGILKELEDEGKGTPAGQEPAPKPEEPKKVEEPKEESKTQEPKEEPPKPDDDPEKPQKQEREPRFVPVSKHNEERHKRQEAERIAEEAKIEADRLRAQLKDATDKPIKDEIDDRARRLAEKHDLQLDFVRDLITETAPKSVLPPDIAADLQFIKEQKASIERQKAEIEQDKWFKHEFQTIVKEFPDLSDQEEELKKLAFSDGNLIAPLRTLAIAYRYDNPARKPDRKTVEDPVPAQKDSSPVYDFANVTEEDVKTMDFDTFDLYQKWRVKNPNK